MTELHSFAIAVVDDDQRVLRSLKDLLESADHEVRVFSSATALLESGELPGIDCLISDVDMPAMNGFELLHSVSETRPELPIILITGYPEMLNRLSSSGPGRYRVFKKPFDGKALLASVGDALRKS